MSESDNTVGEGMDWSLLSKKKSDPETTKYRWPLIVGQDYPLYLPGEHNVSKYLILTQTTSDFWLPDFKWYAALSHYYFEFCMGVSKGYNKTSGWFAAPYKLFSKGKLYTRDAV